MPRKQSVKRLPPKFKHPSEFRRRSRSPVVIALTAQELALSMKGAIDGRAKRIPVPRKGHFLVSYGLGGFGAILPECDCPLPKVCTPVPAPGGIRWVCTDFDDDRKDEGTISPPEPKCGLTVARVRLPGFVRRKLPWLITCSGRCDRPGAKCRKIYWLERVSLPGGRAFGFPDRLVVRWGCLCR